ncbi:MAG: TetR/AcrR family transcriptional regulator [Woeseiaceae bacterium]|nr:TetR/AcrR family transcriptional regulator [Woeseiaceae bacterium]
MVEGTKRTVGRPRARNKGPAGPAKDAILLAAAELFASRGYAATSTREIADRVGIRQPSLFYHYSRKEDILRAIVDQAAAALIEKLPGFERREGRAAVKLYELMKLDFLYLLTEPYRIGQLMLLPELRSGELRRIVAKKRNRIIGAYRKLIKLGIEEGDFQCSDVTVATFTVFGMGEATWTWYRPSRTKTPARIAENIADMALRALLVEPGRLESVKNAAKSSP